MIKGLLVNNTGFKIVTLEPTLENYYELLECDLIDITVREVAGKRFNIVCDDEGLHKHNNHVSAYNFETRDGLVGNLLIANDDGKGNLSSLSNEDINLILNKGTLHIKDDALGGYREILKI